MQSKYANLKSDNHNPGKRQQYVTELFDGLAGRYDRFNRFVSFNRDATWRRHTIESLKDSAGGRVIDLAAGTGDLSHAALTGGASEVHVFDIASNMLRIAQKKMKPVHSGMVAFEQGSAHALPFKEDSFDGLVSAFAMRNVFHFLDPVLAEMYRVLKPGGRFAILELSKPQNPLIFAGFKLHMRYIMPLIGKLASGQWTPFRYLCETTMTFLPPAEFTKRLEKAGFCNVKWSTFLLGGIAIHSGEKPDSV
jgi:ubiquinone/menaquinone biosynthesis methyltransferase